MWDSPLSMWNGNPQTSGLLLSLPFVHSKTSAVSLPNEENGELSEISKVVLESMKCTCILGCYVKIYNQDYHVHHSKLVLMEPIILEKPPVRMQWFPLASVDLWQQQCNRCVVLKELLDVCHILAAFKKNPLECGLPQMKTLSYLTDTSIPSSSNSVSSPVTPSFADATSVSAPSFTNDARRYFHQEATKHVVTERDRAALYDTFLQVASPSHMMSAPQFCHFLHTHLHFMEVHCLRLFKLLDGNSLGYLNFFQFLLGMVCVDPTVPHSGHLGELRCRIIFRFYDSDKDEALSMDELQEMLSDIQVNKKRTPVDPEGVRLQVETILRSTGTTLVTEKQFLLLVGELKLRGTSRLLRSGVSVLQKLREDQSQGNVNSSSLKRHYPAESRMEVSPSPVITQSKSPVISPASDPEKSSVAGEDMKIDICDSVFLPKSQLEEVDNSGNQSTDTTSSSHQGILEEGNNDDGEGVIEGFLLNEEEEEEDGGRSKKRPRCHHPQLHYRYEVAMHTVKVKRCGEVTNISTLWDSSSGASTDPSILVAGKSRMERLKSIDTFNQKSHANEMLNGLRFFERSISRPDLKKAVFSWGPVDRRGLATCFLALCDTVLRLLETEARLLRLSSPCYILGDLHGNYSCLMTFEKALWRLGPLLMPARFLFLGDYVDRGPHGVEIVAYLFAQKALCPHKIHLLRGNHEIRNIQETFTFKEECKRKFGESLGTMVWERVNECFDRMPLAALVDEQVFCVHGGIPRASLLPNLDMINHIECPLVQVSEASSPLAWELMWSDPMRPEEETVTGEVRDQTVGRRKSDDPRDAQFLPNTRRGTACFFSTKALHQFLARHNLRHVIRAHEIKQEGFQIQQHARLLTVFSSSGYCNYANEAACVLADQGKLRVIRLDPS